MEQSVVRILLVEDNPADAYMLERQLQESQAAFEVCHVETLEQARRVLGERPCDAILLDLSLPDSLGMESVEQALAVAPELPILVLTGLDDEAVGLEAVRRGAQDYLIKGRSEPALLARAIRYAIHRKSAERALKQLKDTLELRVAERTAELQLRADQLARLAAELTLVEHRERRRLAQVLHDHLQQLLVGAKFGLQVVARRGSNPAQHEPIRQVERMLSESLEVSRSLAVELCPPVLHDGNLHAGLAWLGRRMREQYGLEVELVGHSEAAPGREDVRIFLFQAVRELLFNVVKHAGVKSARVEIARQSPGHLRVTVSDRGRGFDPRSAGHRPDSTLGGMGLFSLRERLAMMGGKFEADSAPGAGARFTLVAPMDAPLPAMTVGLPAIAPQLCPGPAVPAPPGRELAGAAEAAAAKTAAAKSGAGPRPTRILLADDHAVVRHGLAALLQDEPDLQIVGQASDGAEAVELARVLRPDVVLMDCTMPAMDGVAATRAIRAELPGTRVIGLSMHEAGQCAASMRRAGAAAYIAKSGSPRALLAAIRGQDTDRPERS